jgi:hypothetical protein
MLYNTQGQMLLTQSVEAGSKTQIDIAHLSPGIYFISINGTVFKLVVE